MKMLSVIFLYLSAFFCFSGCTLTEQQNSQFVKQQKNIIEFTVIEGKTTKQEVLDALGNPYDMDSSGYHYNYLHKPNDQLNLHIIKKDKTSFNMVFSENEKPHSVWIYFDVYGNNPNVVWEVAY